MERIDPKYISGKQQIKNINKIIFLKDTLLQDVTASKNSNLSKSY